MSADTVITLPDTNDARSGRGDTTVHRNNFVERGCGFTVDFDQGICYVDRGIIHYVYDGTYYRVEVNTSTDSNVLDLEASASHDVYYDFDDEQLVVTTDSAPSEPRLKIGTVDTTTETYDDTLNREPTRFGRMGSASNPNPAHWNRQTNAIDRYIFPDESPQTVIDAAGEGETIAPSDPSTAFDVDRLEVTTDDLTLRDLSLRTADGSDDVALWVHACSGVTVERATIDGNKANQTVSAADGIANGIIVSDASDIEVTASVIQDTKGQGIAATSRPRDTNKATGAIDNVSIRRCVTDGVENGDFLLSGGAGLSATNGELVGCVARNATQDVFNIIDGFQDAEMRNCRFVGDAVALAIEQHAERGVDRAVRDVTIGPNYLERTTENPVVEWDHNVDSFQNISFVGTTIVGPDPSTNSMQAVNIPSGFTIEDLTFDNVTIEQVGQCINSQSEIDGLTITNSYLEALFPPAGSGPSVSRPRLQTSQRRRSVATRRKRPAALRLFILPRTGRRLTRR
jgi:hypothetical protein